MYQIFPKYIFLTELFQGVITFLETWCSIFMLLKHDSLFCLYIVIAVSIGLLCIFVVIFSSFDFVFSLLAKMLAGKSVSQMN